MRRTADYTWEEHKNNESILKEKTEMYKDEWLQYVNKWEEIDYPIHPTLSPY